MPTVRERDGLALSSRNAYLSPDERALAPTLHRVLLDTGERIQDGMSIEDAAARGTSELTMSGFDGVDYLAVVDAETLEPLERLDRPARILVAVQLGRARLIDNERSSRLRVRARLVVPGLGPEHAGEPVPAVDRDDREGQIDDLLFAELLAGLVDRASGTGPSASHVTASVQASAARSRGVKNGASSQAATAYSRCSVSPAARASIVCMSRQKAQWLSCDARTRTSSSSAGSSGTACAALREFQHRLVGIGRGLGVVQKSGHGGSLSAVDEDRRR